VRSIRRSIVPTSKASSIDDFNILVGQQNNVDDVIVVKTTHHMDNGINFSNIEIDCPILP